MAVLPILGWLPNYNVKSWLIVRRLSRCPQLRPLMLGRANARPEAARRITFRFIKRFT